MQAHRSILGNRQGVALPVIALFGLALLGMVGIAVDLGFLLGARTEAQKVADAAALAGAGAYLISMDEDDAELTAIDYASRNTIRGTSVEVLPEDVTVIPDSQKVRVRVRRTEDRGNAIETVFMRVLGIRQVDVSALAAAQAFPAGGINGSCLIPFAIPDRWRESTGDWPTINDDFEPPADEYVAWIDDPADATGYSYPASIGFRLQIRGQQPSGSEYQPGWWRTVWYWGDQVPGANDVMDAIENCVQTEPEPVQADDVYQTQPGNLSGPQFRQSFQHVIDEDPGAYWEDPPGCNCVRGSAFPPGASPRLRPLSLFDPREPLGNGAFPLRITGFVNVFIESVSNGHGQPSVWVRYTTLTGVLPGEWSPAAGPVARVLRLVE